VTARDLTGAWAGNFQNELRTSSFTFTQTGTTLSGTRVIPGAPGTASLGGNVANPRNVTITSPGFGRGIYCPFSLSGTVNDTSTQIQATGTTSGVCGTLPLTLTLQRQ
jgi:hypothetical protein